MKKDITKREESHAVHGRSHKRHNAILTIKDGHRGFSSPRRERNFFVGAAEMFLLFDQFVMIFNCFAEKVKIITAVLYEYPIATI